MSVPNVLPAAQDEIAEAIDWYEARRPGLGHVPEGGPEVVAVAHSRRRPGYWLARIGP